MLQAAQKWALASCLRSLAGASSLRSVVSFAKQAAKAPPLRCGPGGAWSARRPHRSNTQCALPAILTRVQRRRTHSFARFFSNTQGTSFSDPSRPDLFYHLLDHSLGPGSDGLPVFALSFLDIPPSTPDSSTVIGWLPAVALTEGAHAKLGDFVENPKFRALLHEAISSGLKDGVDDIQVSGAIQLGDGWMHIHDARNIPPLGRIGDPDDIIACVLVNNGKILPETYQPMPSYRLCTSDGVTQLTEGLARRFLLVLRGRSDSEKATVKTSRRLVFAGNCPVS